MLAAILAGVEILRSYRGVAPTFMTDAGEPHFLFAVVATVGKDKLYKTLLQDGSAGFLCILYFFPQDAVN